MAENQPGEGQVKTPSLGEAAGGNAPATASTVSPSSAPAVPPVRTASAAPAPTTAKPAPPAPARTVTTTVQTPPHESTEPTPQPAPALPINASTVDKDAALQGKLGAKVQGDQQVSPGAVSQDTGVDNPLTPFSKPAEGTKRYTVSATAGRKFWFDGNSLRPGDTVYLTDEQAMRAGSRVEKA